QRPGDGEGWGAAPPAAGGCISRGGVVQSRPRRIPVANPAVAGEAVGRVVRSQKLLPPLTIRSRPSMIRGSHGIGWLSPAGPLFDNRCELWVWQCGPYEAVPAEGAVEGF